MLPAMLPLLAAAQTAQKNTLKSKTTLNMKKALIFPLLLFLLLFTMRAQGETATAAAAAATTASSDKVTIEAAPPGSADSVMVVTGKDGEKILSLGKGKGHDLSLNIVGFELGLGPKQSPWADLRDDLADSWSGKNKKGYRGRMGYFEFGFNGLTPPDYRAYADDEKGFLDLRTVKSTYVALYPLHSSTTFWFVRNKRFGMSTALGVAWRDYVFNNDITLVSQSGMVRPAPVPPGTRKSKLSTFSLVIPWSLEYSFSNNMFVSAGAYLEYPLVSHTKYRSSSVSVRSRGSYFISPGQAGITARVGVGCIYLFGNYSWVDKKGRGGLFKNGRGPGTAVYTFGLGIGL